MTKKCIICKEELPIDQFPRDKARSNGRYPRCSPCRAKYYLANRERFVAQMAEYRRRPGIREKINADHKVYAARRFFHIRANNLKIRAKVRHEVATTAEVSRLWKQQLGTCPVTGRRLNRESAQLDHIIPLVKGGSDLVGNLRWVHRDVNYAKRDLLDDDFFRLCLDVVANLNNKP